METTDGMVAHSIKVNFVKEAGNRNPLYIGVGNVEKEDIEQKMGARIGQWSEFVATGILDAHEFAKQAISEGFTDYDIDLLNVQRPRVYMFTLAGQHG